MRIGSYRFEDRVGALLPMLEAASTQDKAAEKRRAGFVKWAVFSGIAMFFSLFLVGFSGLFAFLLAGLLLALVVFIVLAIRSGRHDLDNRKLESTIRLLKVLRADIPDAQRVLCNVDFRDYRKGGRLLSKEGSWATPRMYLYEQRWLDVRARLADGNVLSVSVTDRVKRREKPKRKRTKVVERSRSRLRLLVRLDRRYGDAAAVMERLRALPQPSGLVCRPPVTRGRILRALAATPVSIFGTPGGLRSPGSNSGDAVLQLLRWVYRGFCAPRQAA